MAWASVGESTSTAPEVTFANRTTEPARFSPQIWTFVPAAPQVSPTATGSGGGGVKATGVGEDEDDAFVPVELNVLDPVDDDVLEPDGDVLDVELVPVDDEFEPDPVDVAGTEAVMGTVSEKSTPGRSKSSVRPTL